MTLLPLESATLVSLEQAVAAPFATRQLADLGAQVIKVECPGSEDFARGRMSLAGAMGGHAAVAELIGEYGTPEQRERYLSRLATGKHRHDGADRAGRRIGPPGDADGGPPQRRFLRPRRVASSTGRRPGSRTRAAAGSSHCCARQTRQSTRRTAG